MADVKITDLPNATTPLAGNEPVPIVQAGVTSQATTQDIANLATGGTLAGDVTGPSGSNTVVLVGGQSAVNVAAAATAVAAATANATPSTLMERDGSGNTHATTFIGALTGNASTATTATTATSFTGSLAGDVTGTQGATAIASNVVTNAKLAQMAAHTFKGNNTGATANALDLTATELTAELNLFSSTLKGLVPPSGGGTTNFLRADGTWTTGAGGVSSVNGQTGVVALTTTDIPEGSNLYFTNGRVLAAATSAAASNSVVARDGFASSSFGAVTATTLTGNLSNTSTIDTVSVASVLSGAAAGNSATASPTSNTIAKRDGFGVLVATGFSGGDLIGNATNVTGVVAIANGGTGQSNQQAGLNNLTDIGSHNNGDVLQLIAGNAQFAPFVTPPPSGFPANTFAGFDGSGTLSNISGWSVSSALGASVNVTQNVIDDGFHVWNEYTLGLDPSVNSPTATWNHSQFFVAIDPNSTGDTIGTSGQAARILDLFYFHHGKSNIGGLAFLEMESDLGNGVDPITIKGIAYSFGFGNIHAGVTIDGSIQGYTFQPTFDAGALTTSNTNVQAFSDFLNAPNQTIYGHTSLSCGANIGTIPNNNGFTGVNINPTIGTFVGNAGFNGVFVGGAITTMAATGNYNGFSVNPAITTSHGFINCFSANPQIAGGDGQVTLFQGNMNQVTSSNPNPSVLNLSGLTADNKQSSFSADNVHVNFGGVMVAESAQSVQGEHVLFTQFSLPTGATVGTDCLMNILSPDINFGAPGDSLAVGPAGLGSAMVVFAGQLHGHGQIDQLSALLAGGIFSEDFILPEWRNVNAVMINAGYTGVCTNATAFYHEITGAGPFAANHWGLKVVSDIDNYVTKFAINTGSQKATAGYVLDVVGKSQFAGQVEVSVAGDGLSIKEGSNAKMGTVVLVAGAATVSTTAVTANSRIFLTNENAPGGKGNLSVANIVPGTSFDIGSDSVTDVSTIAWIIVEAI